MKTITLPQLPWHGTRDLVLPFPDAWNVDISHMTGHGRPALTPSEIERAVRGPIGMPPLREYAAGKNEVVIIFDDMARVTRVSGIVPHVLTELAAAGVPDEKIRFVCANGCHGALDRLDFVKKLGEGVVARFPVYNHSPFTNCLHAGTTSAGTPLSFNAEVMGCDLKIGIGSVVPHIMAGFGGGNKIVLPGVASYETILALHTPRRGGTSTVSGMGSTADNPRRQDIDEAAAIIGLDMICDALVNGYGETAALFAGAPGPCYRAALAAAREHYLTRPARGKDIVILNSFAKASEGVSGLLIGPPSLKEEGGDIVLIANAPDGQMPHYLMGPWGNSIGGRLQLRMKLPDNVRRLFIFTEYPEPASRYYIEDLDRLNLVNDWERLLQLLADGSPARPEVAVYPNADIQYAA